jgi:hypothetical protein
LWKLMRQTVRLWENGNSFEGGARQG